MARFPTRFCFILSNMLWSYNPGLAVTRPVWASSLSLATTQEITIVFSSSAYLDVSVQQVCAYMQYTFSILGFPIRKSADQFIFADTRSLSQLITSFIASESQGIPRVPFLTFFYTIRFCPYRYAFVIVALFVARSQLKIASINTTTLFLTTYNLKTTSLLLFSLSIIFFQYVKELFYLIPQAHTVFTAQNLRSKASVENNGFEPLTPCVQGRCSSQLS